MVEAVTVDKHLCARVDPLVDDRIFPASIFAVYEVEALREVVRRQESSEDDIHKRGDVWYGPWLPKYGCAVQRTMVNAAELKLEVVFIDGWERALHFLQTGKCVHSAVPKIYNVLHCADLDPALEGNLGKLLTLSCEKPKRPKDQSRVRRQTIWNMRRHHSSLQLLTVNDIVRCSFDEETLYALTQKLTANAKDHFKNGGIQYMELCVLEDKAERLVWKATQSNELSSAQLVYELVNVRQWIQAEYPYWLALEVIRHEQFVTVQHLVNDPGTACQLNMACV